MIGSHIIPRAYLEKFAERPSPRAKTGRFWVYERDKPPRIGAPKAEGVENGYFAIELPSGDVDESMEATIQKMEDAAGETLELASNPLFVWSHARRKAIATYVALLHSRSRLRKAGSAWLSKQNANELREAVKDETFAEEMAAHYSALGKQFVSVEMIRRIAENLAESIIQPPEIRNVFVSTLLHNTDFISSVLIEKPWQVWMANENEFVTTDSPVVSALEINGHFNPGWGFNKPGVQVFFPLNPTACLVIGNPGYDHVNVNGEQVSKVNELLAMCVSRYAYSLSPNESLRAHVDRYAGTMKFGENAFFLPKDQLVDLKGVLLGRIPKDARALAHLPKPVF